MKSPDSCAFAWILGGHSYLPAAWRGSGLPPRSAAAGRAAGSADTAPPPLFCDRLCAGFARVALGRAGQAQRLKARLLARSRRQATDHAVGVFVAEFEGVLADDLAALAVAGDAQRLVLE